MPGFSNIVCCTDFSQNAQLAFEEASSMATLMGGRLFLLHVVHAGVGEAALAIPAAQREAEAAMVLERLKETYGSQATVETEITLRSGDVITEILAFAAEVHADLIVVGARGIGRLEGFLGGGSVAERIGRTSKIPVLVVATRHHEEQRAGRTEALGQQPLVAREAREAEDREVSARLGDSE